MPGPFDNLAQPWEPVRGTSLSLLDDIDTPAFDPAAFPTEESIVAEIEAEQAAGAPLGAIPGLMAPSFETAAAEEPPSTNALQAPSWASPQLSPEAEAELTGEPVGPSPEYSADLAARYDGFEAEADIPGPTLGVDLGLDPSGVIDPGADPLSDEEMAEVPGVEAIAAQDLSDEALAMRKLDQDQAAEALRREREREELAETTARKVRDADIYQKSIAKANQRTEEILQRAQEIGSQTVDNKNFVNSLSTVGKIGMALSILAGGQLGIASGRGGNEALDLFKRLISEDIETQKFNIQQGIQGVERERGIVAQLYEQTGDLYAAAETARLAAYEAGLASIDADMARLDPEGTQAVEKEIQRRQMRAQVEAKRAEIAAQQRKNALEEAKLEAEFLDKESAIRKREAEIRKLDAEAAKLARRGGGKKREDIYTPDYWEGLYGPDARPPIAMSKSEHADWLTTRGKVAKLNPGADPKAAADLEKARAEARMAGLQASSGPDGNPYAIGDHNGDAIKQKNGDPFMVADVALRNKLSSMYTAAMNIRRLADLGKILKKKEGGASAIIGSPEYQEFKTLAASIDFETYKAFDLGAPSAGDQQMAEDARGGKDITSYIYDASAGWDAYATQVEKKVNNHFRVQGGYTGPDLKIPSRKPKGHEEKPASEIINEASRGLRPDIAALDPSDPRREKAVANMAERVTAAAERGKAYGWRNTAASLMNSNLTESEVLDVAAPLARKVARQEAQQLASKHRGEIERMSPEDLAKSQTPWAKRIRELHQIESLPFAAPGARKKALDFLLEGQDEESAPVKKNAHSDIYKEFLK